jgi:TonB family protein
LTQFLCKMIFAINVSDNKHAVKLSRILGLLTVFAFLILPLSAQTKKRGKVTAEYSNGKKESSGKVKNYKKQGVWKYWSENGVLTKTETYKDDVKQGLYTEFYADGKKSVEGNYLNGRKDGTWNSWYSDGKLSSKLNYDGTYAEQNTKEGLQQWWFENGQLREQSNYVNHQLVSRATWYNNGKKKSVEYYKNKLPNGTWRTYPAPSESTDTLPSKIANYADGKREGIQLGYYHGRLSEEIFYEDDKLNGTFQKWDTKGQLGVYENYVDGKLDGLCKYYNYGKCIREVTYVKGKKHGEEKEYDANGELYRISWYKMSIIDSSYNYHKNGKLAISRTYKYYPGFVYTEEFSVYTEWDENGVLLLRGTYHFEKKDKEWTTFYADGKVKSVTPWSNGIIHGTYKKWYANGKPMIELECETSSVVAQPKVWDEKGKVIKPGTKAYNEIVDSSKPGEIYNDPKQYRNNRTNDEQPPVQVEEVRLVGQDGPWGVDDVMQDGDDNEPIIFAPTMDRQIDSKPDEVFTYAEVMPKFPGDTLQNFLRSNIKYPQVCMDANKQGTVYIRYTVEKDGSVTNVKEAKGVPGAPEFTQEAIRVVRSFPKQTPGLMNGRPVRIEMTIPVKFVLQ